MNFTSTATVRRAFLELVPIIALVLGYQEVSMSQAKAVAVSRMWCSCTAGSSTALDGRACTTR